MRRIVVPVGAGGKKRVKDRGIGGVEFLAAPRDHQRLSPEAIARRPIRCPESRKCMPNWS